MPAPPTAITVEKAKWDGSVSARWRAVLLPAQGAIQRWRTSAGTLVERPRRGDLERAGHDSVSVTAGTWWVVSAVLDGEGRPAAYEVDACTPVAPCRDGVLRFLDLDIDLELTDESAALLDQEEFRRHAVEMGYPDRVRRCALIGLRDALQRFCSRRWPFDGSLGDLREAPR
jgi:protein associated with RNAse G/E